MSKFAKGLNLKNAKVITKKEIYFINFRQLIYLLPSIICPDLELLAATVFEISSLICQIFVKSNDSKKI